MHESFRSLRKFSNCVCRVSLRFSSGLELLRIGGWSFSGCWSLVLGIAPQFDPGLGCGSAALCLCASVVKNFFRRSRPHQKKVRPPRLIFAHIFLLQPSWPHFAVFIRLDPSNPWLKLNLSHSRMLYHTTKTTSSVLSFR